MNLFLENTKRDDNVGSASALHVLGMIETEQGNLTKACSYFEDEMKFREMAGGVSNKVLSLTDQIGWLMR